MHKIRVKSLQLISPVSADHGDVRTKSQSHILGYAYHCIRFRFGGESSSRRDIAIHTLMQCLVQLDFDALCAATDSGETRPLCFLSPIGRGVRVLYQQSTLQNHQRHPHKLDFLSAAESQSAGRKFLLFFAASIYLYFGDERVLPISGRFVSIDDPSGSCEKHSLTKAEQ